LKSFTQEITQRICENVDLSKLLDGPGFGWERVNFSPSSCCVLDLVGEECW